VRARRAALSA
jgi:hypothetical protein